MSQTKWIEIETVHSFITNELDGVVPKDAWGETSYFYNPGHVFQRGTYFATIKQKDGANDRASHLDRSGVWRLNLGVSKEVFFELFGPPPPRPGKGGVIDGGWDFAASDQLMPHPIYGWMSWISVLNPSRLTWGKCLPLVSDAHLRAKGTFEQRRAKQNGLARRIAAEP
ncbi:conserved hypothetical protein [Roseovarius sp. EC-HK134]|uniref:DUF6194 family protein n=1 Tax=Roseovarius TaxID=74030 RepID=UPI001255C1E3|nr:MULTISPECIES: DUF6194 family protein [unclassified Roseovarius]VVT18120.1 conserved hypothetical protein [Roseovarius sp. EC-HK134]VVT18490.1 conserved hypothetical protein [Roseovarius sp. EC-SD190]